MKILNGRYALILIQRQITAVLLCLFVQQLSQAATDTRPADPAQETALLEQMGDGFWVKRTPHFLIVSDSNRALVDEFMLRAEQTYQAVYRFCSINKIEVQKPSRRLEILFFDTQEGYERYSANVSFPSAGTYGFYFEPTNRSAFFNMHDEPRLKQMHANITAAKAGLDRLIESVNQINDNRVSFTIQYPDGRTRVLNKPQAQKEIDSARRTLKTLDAQRSNYSDRLNRTVIQHEVAHQILFNAGVHVRGAGNPKWLVEGLACLFETPPEADAAGVGVINQLRLQDFRKVLAGENIGKRLTSISFCKAVEEERIVDPKRLVSDSKVFNERGERGAANYAAAWALMHYLHRVHLNQLAAYIEEVRQRQPGYEPPPEEELALFEKHFGLLEKPFIMRWGDYILKIGVRSINGR